MNALSSSTEIAVIGAGAMGSGIAQVAAAAGHTVWLFDVREGAAAKSREQIRAMFTRLVEKGRMKTEQAQMASEALRVASSINDVAAAGLVIEAIVEDLEAKQHLFLELEAVVDPTAILATNTSSVSITAIAAKLAYPGRVAGLHFFNPAPLMALVEVVSGLATDKTVAQTLYQTALAWGKKPVLTRSTPGFIVNRVARPYYAEALRLLEEQVSNVDTLDALMREGGGFPMGPFELMDLIGHDVNFAVTCSVFQSYFQDPRYKPSLSQQELVSAGFLGRKSGRGFYFYGPQATPPAVSEHEPKPVPAKLIVEGNLGPAEDLLASPLQGVDLQCVQGGGLLRMDGCTLALSDGRSATIRSAEDNLPNLVLFDLALDFKKSGRLAIARADQASPAAIDVATGLLQALGWRVSVIDDTPGLVVLRTVAMLANEASDALMQSVATAHDIDRAMRFGVNYPEGPLAWADRLGADYLYRVLDNIQRHYQEDRYRPSALLRRLAAGKGRFVESQSSAP
ncbi:3-hydroxyacyl-CoA dehydrogenase PaaC [Pseudomonas sp. v388]|uniref:3-hydroxyacyl-CoA dehydrogenase PaaH n=1 Tax=Pseudomonas sp. v388 TaxID=2479849 RepID=UPI000F7793BB|nr:3-hydroxyacyl-CoA dehydrogenase PaaH [Pseudomonas sp. v388]RRV10476.1 3-hydroxyacyl-CoA dehydrogenase PaaC [Pseudomonas sp. v388]